MYVMRVLKRSGDFEEVSFDKVLNRIRKLSEDLNVDIFDVSQKVCGRIYDNVKTSELDELAAHICSSMMLDHPDYGVLASRIIISNHQKNTSPSFSETVQIMYDNVDGEGKKNPLISDELYQTVIKNREKLNTHIDYTRDYNFDYFGFKTLERSYLMRVNGKIVERPQHMFMRVAIGIHGDDLKDALQTYDLMSQKYFTHATPTLFNAGTPRPQCSSCFLVSSNGDSIEEIFDTVKDCALISKYSGGIGVHVSDIRSKGSRIRGTNGTSTGIVPMLRVYNNVARYVNQCFTPDTIVFSRDGPKAMEDVTCNDYLVTHDGSFKRVNSIAKNHVDKDILNIKIKYSFGNTRVTPEHEVYVLKNQNRLLDIDVIKNRLDSGYVKPSFTEAKHLRQDDIVGFPIPTYEKDIGISNDWLRFYGIMVGNGDISNDSSDYKITLNLSSKYDVAKFCEDFLQRSNVRFWSTIDDIQDTYTITWYNQDIGITYEDLFDAHDVKKIQEEFLHLPKDKLMALVKGLMETAGSYGTQGLSFQHTSLSVVMAFRYILIRYGILTSGYTQKVYKGYHTHCKYGRKMYVRTIRPAYVVSIPNSEIFKCIFTNYVPNANEVSQRDYFEHNNILWSRVDSITKERYKGLVYDFNMMDNHNYTVANLGLVHNSGRRNGSIAVYLEPWHADVEHFLDLRKNHGNEEDRTRDLFLALWIPDLFMERVKSNAKWSLMCPDQCKMLNECYGDEFVQLYEQYEKEGKYSKQVNAQDLWFKILESQIETGTPYLLYKDAANRKSNQQNLGTIKSSNLCVAPDTMILTSDGYFPIKELCGQTVNVWNGKQFSSTVVHQTGRMQKLITVKFDNGMELKCTPYHKFYIETAPRQVVVQAKDLAVGMRIIRYETPTLNSKGENIKYAYTQGLFASHGQNQYNNGVKPFIWLFGSDKNLINNVEWTSFCEDKAKDVMKLTLPDDIKNKYFVPLNNSLDSKLRWLEGYLDGCGDVIHNNGHAFVQTFEINKSFLKTVSLMLQTLGVQACVSSYKASNRLTINTSNLTHLRALGFAPKRLVLSNIKSFSHNLNAYVRVAGIEDNAYYDDTYCFTEPLEHKGIFNGILTGQCSEIIEYSSPDECAVCNLASICLPTFIRDGVYDFAKLHDITKVITKNLNKVIDLNYYPIEKAKVSNWRHRPIGIGIQGLADVFAILKMPFDSDEAAKLNKDIFETIYHGAVEASMEIAKKRHEFARRIGNDTNSRNELMAYLHYNEYDPKPDSRYPGAYSSFEGSPASQGKLQFDLWGIAQDDTRYDWTTLKNDIQVYGLRNSLFLAPMPTASTSQIMGFNESFEAFTSNMYKRKTLAGEFIILNKYLLNDLMKEGIWNMSLRDKLMVSDGSVQHIDEIPQHIKDIYKTAWEIKQKVIIDQAADRGIYVCQSQSMNLYMEDPDFKKLTSMHFYAWSKGLKTGVYYLRTKPRAQTQKFTLDPNLVKKKNVVCNAEDGVCLVCSS